ncbi:TSUP family transporter [Flavobacterium sp. RHBU_3]|uniref:TSUP family transporter n=1 Tax=Flavobacterium sp. RHBU_3 TaxID=3391184 RepID=UPI00398553A5
MKNTLFPIFLKTETSRFLIVGGGKVGLEKTQTLLKQNPDVLITVVSPEINPELRSIILLNENIELLEREFITEDLNEVDFIIIATANTALNRGIREQAKQKGVLVNAADQPALCDFYLGSIVNKGSLKIAFSTNGKSPVLARRLREYFEQVIPDEVDTSINQLNKLRNAHAGDFSDKLKTLNKITAPLAVNNKAPGTNKKLITTASLLFMVFIVGYSVSALLSGRELLHLVSGVPSSFYIMLAVGFVAQLVDGALGMGYGIMCSTMMMLFGVNLPVISSSIHTAEVFSSAVSGYTHYKFGNVNKRLLLWLAIPGVSGAVAGALLLIYVGNTYATLAYITVAIYTFSIGLRLIYLALKNVNAKSKIKKVGFLGFTGGFMDSFAGGGWGPIVTSTLLAKGRKMNFVVGTVSLSEFFVTFAAAVTFFASLGITHWTTLAGIIIGGTIAAPFAARLSGKLPRKIALLLVATLVITFSIRILLKLL